MSYRLDVPYNPHRINPPDEPEPEAVCESCGCYLYEDDPIYKADGEILCESCLKDRFKITLDFYG